MAMFRFHRGQFKDSLLTKTEVISLDALVSILKCNKQDITMEYYAYDDHKGWEAKTYIVMVNKIPVGFIDKPV